MNGTPLRSRISEIVLLVSLWGILSAAAALALAKPGGTPRLVVPQGTKELGVLKEGEIVPLSFMLENHGDADLLITAAKGDCGCTVVRLEPQPVVVKPGESFELHVEFDTRGRARQQDKKITVATNDPAQPEVVLKFTAEIFSLFQRRPTGSLILQKVRRGETALNFVEFMPGSVGQPVEITGANFDPGAPFTAKVEPFSERGRTGQRIMIGIEPHALLGMVYANLNVELKVGDQTATETVPVRAEIVGDLTFRPLVVDTTRRKSLPGQRLTPVVVESTSSRPINILNVDAGPMLDAEIMGEAGGKAYTVQTTVRSDAPVGPFAAMMKIYTDSLDEPLLRVPIFGEIAPVIDIEPPLVLLRADGTEIGGRRRVRLQAAKPSYHLELSNMKASADYLTAVMEASAQALHTHLLHLEVMLTDDPPPGRHDESLTFTTAVPGAETLVIPVTILGPGSPGPDGAERKPE